MKTNLTPLVESTLQTRFEIGEAILLLQEHDGTVNTREVAAILLKTVDRIADDLKEIGWLY
jgi:hypothetical protein